MTDNYKTAADWLAAWDAGREVQSVEMGGISPGYEQAIQITTAEILRWLVANNEDTAQWVDPEKWARTRDKISNDVTKIGHIDRLGLSGAQWGASISLATTFYKRGPSTAMLDDEIQDRLIQVKKDGAL